jgi:hypothetical protein
VKAGVLTPMPVVEGTYIEADQADNDAGGFATLVAARGLTLEASVLGRGGTGRAGA